MMKIFSLLLIAALAGVPLRPAGAVFLDTGLSALLERPLHLGAIVQGVAAGTVSVSPEGLQSCVAIQCLGGAYSGLFSVRGAADTLIQISASNAVLRNDAGATMMLQPTLSSTNLILRASDVAGAVPFGGTLDVAAQQAPGSYSGDFDLTVEYQ